MAGMDTLDDLALDLKSLADRLESLSDKRDEELEQARRALADAEDALTDYEHEEGATARRAWSAAEALHHEAHDRWQFLFCQRETCVALKDALLPEWRGMSSVAM